MAIKLYDHQLAAIDKLRTGSILCGGVGSGKSRTALTYFYINVCKGKMRINGYGESAKPIRNLPLYVITTARKRDSEDWEKEASPFLGINMVVDSWNNIKKYANVKNAFFIFDEQRVVGYGTWSKSFIKIAKNNKWILLTATPGDVWMDYAAIFIANGFYKDITDFRKQHVIYSRFSKFPKIERYVNIDILERRRNKILVNMPFDRPTISHVIEIKASYNKDIEKKIFKDRWNVESNRPIENISELCYLLRKNSNSDTDRIKLLKQILKENDKCIIFYNFNYELDILKEFVKKLGDRDLAEWNGHKHEEVPDCNKWVYLVQYTAGAEAWNCITTNVMIFYSLNYSYKIMEQAKGRIDRMNTPYIDLYYYYFISDSIIDKGIKNALDNKRVFNERAFAITRD